MKFFTTLTLVLATISALVVAQEPTATDNSAPTPCMVCLQDSLRSLRACTSLTIVVGDMDPASDPAFAECLCSSLDGAWIDKCLSTCSQDIVSFKNAYSENIQAAGLICGAQPTFVPAPRA